MNKAKPSFIIIIVNYNAGKFLKGCLDSIWQAYQKDKKTKASYQLKKIIIVDNNSTDASKDYLKKLTFPENLTKVIFSHKNLGFSAGNNLGVKEALKDQPDYILFLNPDTIVFANVFKTMIQFMENNPNVGISTCRLELTNGQPDQASHRGFPTPWRAFCHFSNLERLFPKSKLFSGYGLGYLKDNPDPHEIDACSGAFLLIRRPLGEKLSWFDQDYFMYGEDIDLCYRAKQLGQKVFFLPQVKITHFWGVSSGIKPESKKITTANLTTKIKSAKASTEAMAIFYRKHYLNLYPKIVTNLVLAGIKVLTWLRVFKIKISSG